MAADLAHAHAARIHGDDLVVEVREAALVFGDQLRVEAAGPAPTFGSGATNLEPEPEWFAVG
jgi:hypothetical protein